MCAYPSTKPWLLQGKNGRFFNFRRTGAKMIVDIMETRQVSNQIWLTCIAFDMRAYLLKIWLALTVSKIKEYMETEKTSSIQFFDWFNCASLTLRKTETKRNLFGSLQQFETIAIVVSFNRKLSPKMINELATLKLTVKV